MIKKGTDEARIWWEKYSADKRARMQKRIRDLKAKGKFDKAAKVQERLDNKEIKWADKIERGAKPADKRNFFEKAMDSFKYIDPIGRHIGLHKVLGIQQEKWRQRASDPYWDESFQFDPKFSGEAAEGVGGAGGGGGGAPPGSEYGYAGTAGTDASGLQRGSLTRAIQGLDQSAGDYRNMAAQVGGRDVGGDIRADQRSLIEQLQARAAGNVPSAAEMMLMDSLERSSAHNLGMAKSAYGANPALAMRAAMNANVSGQQDARRQAGILRAQEQAQAEGQLAGTLSGVRGQDMQLQQLNDALVAMYEQMGYDAQKAHMAAQMHMQDMAQQGSLQQAAMDLKGYLTELGINAQAHQFQQQLDFARENQPTLLETAISAFGGALGGGLGGGAARAAGTVLSAGQAAADVSATPGSRATPPGTNTPQPFYRPPGT